MAVLLQRFPVVVSICNLVDMFRQQAILGFHFLKVVACVNKQNTVVVLAALTQHQHTGWDTCAIEDIGRQPDYCVNTVHLLNHELANMAFRSSTEQNAMGQHYSHGAVIFQVIEHMLHKRHIRFAGRGQFAVLRKTVIVHKQLAGAPFGRERWVGDNRIKFQMRMLRMFQSIFLHDFKVSIVNAMQNHVHTCQVVGGAVHLLTVDFTYGRGFTFYTQQ
ncbi:Uncharacterised protein [Klebsiella pneumoniae]|nr:Uncharacterised protein [Klebsiella pneumoniae]